MLRSDQVATANLYQVVLDSGGGQRTTSRHSHHLEWFIAIFRMFSKSSMATISISAFACMVQSAVAVIQTRLAISVLPDTNIYGLALVASVLDIICLPVLAAGTVFRFRQLHHCIILPFHLVSAVVLSTASALTIYCLVWTEYRLHADTEFNDPEPLAEVGIVLSGITLIVLVAFYALLLWSKPPQTAPSGVEYGPPQYQPFKPVVSFSLASPSSTPFFAQSLGALMMLVTIPSSQSSMRFSIVPALRPISSKTIPSVCAAYASTTTRSSHATPPTSVVAVHEDEGFHHWVTTTDGAFTSPEETSGKNIKGGRLETPRLATIAGSYRPVSPVNQIRTSSDKTRGGIEKRPSHPSTLLQFVPHSPPSLPTITIPPTLKISESVSSLRSTRPASPTKPDSHIHPLFRSESIGPLPIASPGTIITASPIAGRVVRREQALISVRFSSAWEAR